MKKYSPSFKYLALPSKEKNNQFQKKMHAFYSLLSLDAAGWTSEDKAGSTWVPQEFFELLAEMLEPIHSKNIKLFKGFQIEDKTVSFQFKLFLERVITLIKIIIDLNKSDFEIHPARINKFLINMTSIIIYPWHIVSDTPEKQSGHQAYLIINRKSDSSYTLKISSSDDEKGENKIKQIDFKNEEGFNRYFSSEINSVSLELQKKKNVFYSSANSVVVNLLGAIKQVATAKHGLELGGRFFQIIYLELLKAALEGAIQKAIELPREMPPLGTVMACIPEYHFNFTQLDQGYIGRQIDRLYQELVECTKPTSVVTYSQLYGGNPR